MGARLRGVPRLKRSLKRIGKPSGGHSVDVGIVKSARYPVETLEGRPDRKKPPYVAQVAFWNEFGNKGGWGKTPPRPFMRRAIRQYLRDERIRFLLKQQLDPLNPIFTKSVAGALGALTAGIMADDPVFKDPTFPRNSPVTIAIKTKGKGGVTTPLIDEGLLRRSISFEVKGGTGARS